MCANIIFILLLLYILISSPRRMWHCLWSRIYFAFGYVICYVSSDAGVVCLMFNWNANENLSGAINSFRFTNEISQHTLLCIVSIIYWLLLNIYIVPSCSSNRLIVLKCMFNLVSLNLHLCRCMCINNMINIQNINEQLVGVFSFFKTYIFLK